ncbi:MAG: hypothetical protein ACR2HE_07245 [Casimicrobiaceae bacterium]
MTKPSIDPGATPPGRGDALTRLVNCEEVLQICFWYQGEGFGNEFDAPVLAPFLNCDPDAIQAALAELVTQGHLEPIPPPVTAFRLTAAGKRKGGRLFADDFADYQHAGHGECAAGCCDGDDHSQCGDECALH